MERAVYKPIAFRKLKPGAGYHRQSSLKAVKMDSPAIDVMTDLQLVSAATTTRDASLSAATQAMVSRGVRLLLVVDEGQVIGLITARDTMGERPIKMIQQLGGKHGDLKVRDCMTHLATIEVLTLADVMHAEVGHIVATLKGAGRQHSMVVDTDPLSGDEMIRGIFSITQIGRQLGVSLQAFEVAKTFAEIEAALAA